MLWLYSIFFLTLFNCFSINVSDEYLLNSQSIAVNEKLYNFNYKSRMRSFSMINSLEVTLANNGGNAIKNIIAYVGNDSYSCNTNLIGYHQCTLDVAKTEPQKKVFTCRAAANFVVILSMFQIRTVQPDFAVIKYTNPGEDAEIVNKVKALQNELKGVQSECLVIPKLQYSGSFLLFSQAAVPVFTSAENDVIVALSRIDKGKILFFGNDGYTEMFTNKLNNMHKTFQNILRYIFDLNTINDETVVTMKPKLDLGKLKTKPNVLVFNVHINLNNDEITSIINHVKAGMGLVVTIKNWAYEKYTAAFDVAVIKPLFVESGIWPDTSIKFWSVTTGDTLKTCGIDLVKNPSHLNAQLLLEWCDKSFDVFFKYYTAVEQSQYFVSLTKILKDQHLSIINKYGSFMAAIVPCKVQPVTLTEHKKLIAQFSNLFSGQLLANSGVAAFDNFLYPGWNTNIEPKTVTAKLKIDCQHSEYLSTGFYFIPGNTMEIDYISGDSSNYQVVINFNQFDVRNSDLYSKWPFTTSTKDISKIKFDKKQLLYSGFGGLIWIFCPKPKQILEISLSKVVMAPFYDFKDSASISNWETRQKSPGAWSTIAGKTVVFAAPSSYIAQITNPSTILEMHDKCLLNDFHLRGKTQEKREVVASDLQIKGGYMHAGYPIGVFVSSLDEVLDVKNVLNGGWGIFHEYGHNMLSDSLSVYSGSVDTINNIFTLLCQQEVAGKDPMSLSSGWFKDGNLRGFFTEFFKQENQINKDNLAKNHFAHLTFYADLIHGFGWELFRQTFRKFNALTKENVPNDEAKITYWCLFFSEITGYNLVPYFRFYGFPLIAEKIKVLEKYPLCLPKVAIVEMFPHRVQQVAKMFPNEKELVKPITSKVPDKIGPYVYKPNKEEFGKALTVLSII